jgi:hypothetical protein
MKQRIPFAPTVLLNEYPHLYKISIRLYNNTAGQSG